MQEGPAASTSYHQGSLGGFCLQLLALLWLQNKWL